MHRSSTPYFHDSSLYTDVADVIVVVVIIAIGVGITVAVADRVRVCVHIHLHVRFTNCRMVLSLV